MLVAITAIFGVAIFFIAISVVAIVCIAIVRCLKSPTKSMSNMPAGSKSSTFVAIPRRAMLIN